MNIQDKLLQINPYSRSGEKQGKIQYIVIHYVGNPNTSAIANRNYFNNLAKTHETSASSHYIIGLNGEIIRCVPDEEVAFHSGDYAMNRKSIGIENCHPDSSGKFNDKTYNSLIELCRELCRKYGIPISNVIRHYDVTGKDCPHYYVQNPSAWEKLKNDIEKKAYTPVTLDNIFDGDLYYSLYPDLQKAFGRNTGALRNHYIKYGIKEGRVASYVFNPDYYYSKYPDLQKAFGRNYKALYDHFINNGIRENRQGAVLFGVDYYRRNNVDLQQAFGEDTGADVRHFINNGIKEFRLTSAEFNINKYKEYYPDLQKAFGNDCKSYYKHYLVWGIKEGRKAV